MMSSFRLVAYFFLIHHLCRHCRGYDYCQNENPGTQKLFCLGVDEPNFAIGAGNGCLSEHTCSIIISGRKLYKNSTWFKVYLPIDEEEVRVTVWFLITKQEVSFARDNPRKLGIQETMIARGEAWNNGSMNVYSYRMEGDRKVITSSSFFSFAPDRKSTRMRHRLGSADYTVFSWRASEYLTEGPDTFNYHRTPVHVTLRITSRSRAKERVTVVRIDRHMIFAEPKPPLPSVQVEYGNTPRDEL